MSEIVMCSKCKSWIQPDDRKCPNCGAPIVTEAMLQQDAAVEEERQEKTSKNKAVILSLILFFIITIAYTWSNVSSDLSALGALPGGLALGLVFGGWPCGWVATAGIRRKIKWTLAIPVLGWAFWVWAVGVLLGFTSWIMFPVYTVQFILEIVKKRQEQ